MVDNQTNGRFVKVPDKSSSIKTGAVISYVSVFLSVALTFFYTPWMIRQIGVSNYGLYNLVIAFISYFVMDFGLSGTVTRFIAKYRAEGNYDKISNLLGLVMKIYLVIDAIIFIVLFICYFFLTGIFKGLTPEELETLRVLYVIAGVFSVLSFVLQPMNGALMAFEYFVESKVLDMVQRVGLVVLVVIALLLNGGVVVLVFLNGFVGLIVSLLRYIVFEKKSGSAINWRYFDVSELKSVSFFSGWLFLMTLSLRLRLTIMPAILGALSNSTEISIFALAMSVESIIWTFSTALNGLFLPRVSRMEHEGDSGALTSLMVKVGRIQLLIFSPIFWGFVVFGGAFLHLWVGDGFQKSYYVIICLIGTNLVLFTQQIAQDLVYAENKVKKMAIISLLTSIISLLGGLLLAGNYGAVGCGISFLVAMFIYMLWLNFFYQKQLSINLKRFFRECHLKIMPLTIIVGVLSFVIWRYLALESWFSLIIGVGAFLILYSIIVYVAVLDNSEKVMIKSALINK